MPRNEFVVKRIPELTRDEYRDLHKLNMGQNGLMQQALEECQEYRKGKAVIYYDSSEKISGWALIFRGLNYTVPSSSECLYVYVKPSLRKSGIGKKIVMEARKHTRYRPIVFPWDDRSNQFFIKLGNSVRLKTVYM